VLAFHVVFLVLPYAYLLRMSFNRHSPMRLFVETFTLENYAAVLGDAFYINLVLRTIGLGFAVTLATLALGLPLAILIVRMRAPWKSVLMGIALSPLLINLVVRTYAWLVLLGDRGVINESLAALGMIDAPLRLSGNLFAVWLGLTHITLPLMVLSLVGVTERIDARLFEAAESLGASAARVLAKVLLPLTAPGIASGSLLVFCFTISAFITPALLGAGRVSTVSTVIYEKFTFALNWPVGSTLVFVLLALNLVVIAAHARLFREAGR
jgi:putative spermidine/putrescine transport system permease protein